MYYYYIYVFIIRLKTSSIKNHTRTHEFITNLNVNLRNSKPSPSKLESCKLFIPSNSELLKNNYLIDKKLKIMFTNATYYFPNQNTTKNICHGILDPILSSSDIIHAVTAKKHKRWTSNEPIPISRVKLVPSDLNGIGYCTNNRNNLCLEVLDHENIQC